VGGSPTSAQALFGEESLWSELEPTAMHRLAVDIGGAGGKVQGRSLGGKIFLWVTKKCCCWAKKDKLWLSHFSAVEQR
jgi:hypothetical protein